MRTSLLTLFLILTTLGISVASEVHGVYEEAYSLQVAGEYEKANRKYKEVLDSLTEKQFWPKSLLGMAECCYSMRQFKDSIKHLETIASNFSTDPIAPEALWQSVKIYAGPLKNQNDALKAAKLLKARYYRTEYGEKAGYAIGLIYFWNKDKRRAKEALNRHLSDYPNGKYTTAVNSLLNKIEKGEM